MKDYTAPTKKSDIKRFWHLIDVKDQVLGRIASKIAMLLMGKPKPYFVRNLDVGDSVVIINSKHVKVTGNKEILKKYYRYSGYPGGLKTTSLRDLREKMPNDIIKHAVRGMLPQNKLRDRMMARLFVFKDAEHDYKDKFKVKSENLKVK